MRVLFANELKATVALGEISLTFRIIKNKTKEVAREGTSEVLPKATYARACRIARAAILDKRRRLIKKALEKLEREEQHTFDF